MTEKDLIIQDLRRENAKLRARVQEWISVKDRLPEHGDVVLCFMKFGEQRILQWDSVSSWWLGYGHGDDWQKADVTHWMPTPQPPKGGKRCRKC